MKGIIIEKDAKGNDRFIRFDLDQYSDELRPLLKKLGVVIPPKGWNTALTSDEFLAEAKKMIRQKCDEKNKI